MFHHPHVIGRMDTVKTCKIHGATTFAFHADKRLGGRWRCRKCQVEYTRVNHQKVRAVANTIKLEKGCSNCGYDRCAAALHFHHREASTKEYNPSQCRSVAKLLKEIEKCDVLCANCHIEEHNPDSSNR